MIPGRLLSLLIAAACLSLTLLVSACTEHLKNPNFSEIYTRSALYHGIDRNPIIVMPGVLGSKLKDRASGKTIWGAFGGNYANPSIDEEVRLIALPMRKSVALRDLRDDVVPDGVLDQITVNLAGLPIQIGAYIDIIATLGAGGYRDQQLALSGAVDYGDQHFTCFQFDYDWRRDNVESVKALHRYILDKRAYVKQKYNELNQDIALEDIRFDIAAHSMAGLIVRYYLRYGPVDLPEDGSLPPVTWEGTQYVDRVVLIGTPNAGSVESLNTLVNGADFLPFFPKYQAAILDTMPGLYQLLPRPRHAIVVEKGNRDQTVDPLDIGVWEKYGWGMLNPDQDELLQSLLPNAKTETERYRIARDHIEKSLQRAQHFYRALDARAAPPNGPRLKLVAGDAVATDAVVEVDADSGELTVIEKRPGDGSVTRGSALLDERIGGEWSPMLRSPIEWSAVTFLFTDHLGLTRDPVFTDNVLYYLLEQPR